MHTANLGALFLFLAIAAVQVVYGQDGEDESIYCSYQRTGNQTIIRLKSLFGGPFQDQEQMFGGCGQVSGTGEENDGDYHVSIVDLPRDVDPDCVTDALK